MLFPVFLRKVTKYEANGKKRMHQLRFPCRHLTLAPAPTPLRTNAPTLTHPRHHTHASAPPHSRIRATTHAHLRLRRCAPTTPLAHNRATTHAHLRLRRYAQATPLSRTFVLHLYTLAPPITQLRPPSIHIGAPHCAPSSSLPSFGAYQNQSEFIRAYPISSEKFRWVLIDSD